MRSIWLLLLVICMSVSASLQTFAQGKENNTRKLFKIRQTFQSINNEKNYRIVNLEDPELILGHVTDGGASLTGYFKKDTLKKIIEWIGLSNKVVQNEYYLDSGKLIFVYAIEKSYLVNDSLETLDYTKLVPVFSGRYYFEGNQLIESTLSNNQPKRSIKDAAKRFLRQVKKYSALLNKNRN